MANKRIQFDDTVEDGDWIKARGWLDWPTDLDELRAYALGHWATVELFKATPLFAEALRYRPELAAL